MNMIFSADKNWGIGHRSGLLFKLSGDMAFFRKMTTGKVVVMGRTTFESLPGGKALPDRRNIVLTTNRDFVAESVEICHSLPELFTLLRKLGDDVFVIGGEQVYLGLMPYCKTAYVTRFDSIAPADRFLPDFDALPGWRLADTSEIFREAGINYYHCTYIQENAALF